MTQKNHSVIPAKAGIHTRFPFLCEPPMDPGFRRDDDNGIERQGMNNPAVIPAKAGIHTDFPFLCEPPMDPGFRRDDDDGIERQDMNNLAVIPAQAGIHFDVSAGGWMDSRLRGNDEVMEENPA
jgi:hypothetical protein